MAAINFKFILFSIRSPSKELLLKLIDIVLYKSISNNF